MQWPRSFVKGQSQSPTLVKKTEQRLEQQSETSQTRIIPVPPVEDNQLWILREKKSYPKSGSTFSITWCSSLIALILYKLWLCPLFIKRGRRYFPANGFISCICSGDRDDMAHSRKPIRNEPSNPNRLHYRLIRSFCGGEITKCEKLRCKIFCGVSFFWIGVLQIFQHTSRTIIWR